MILREVEIQDFGKFHHKKISFSPGTNLIYAPNEGGKTTLHTLLQAMLFGLPRGRGRAAKTDLYSRYLPWENPGGYGGSLRFAVGGKEFCLRRQFLAGSQSARLVCETDGELLSVEDGDLEMLLGDVSQAVFENTVSVRQLGAPTGEGLAAALENYMAGCEDGGLGDLDVQGAQRALGEKKRALKKELEGECRLQRERRFLARSRTEDCKGELEELKARRQERYAPPLTAEGEAKERDVEETGLLRKRTASWWGMAALAAGAAAAAFLLPETWRWMVLVCGVFGELLLYRARRRRRGPMAGDGFREGAFGGEAGNWQEKRAWAMERLEEEIARMERKLSELEEAYEASRELSPKEAKLREELEAVELAARAMEELSGRMRARLGDGLREKTSRIFSALTAGTYTQADLKGLEPGAFRDGRYLSLEQLSRGAAEQLYFALRMAAADLLCPEPLPVLLDDVFAMYDDARIKEALLWLEGNREQALLFTCHRREAALLEKLGIPHRRINLGVEE